jgi:hypothetical protein
MESTQMRLPKLHTPDKERAPLNTLLSRALVVPLQGGFKAPVTKNTQFLCIQSTALNTNCGVDGKAKGSLACVLTGSLVSVQGP